MEDGDYRLMLKNVAGVGSCKELRGAKIDLVIKHLEVRVGCRRSQVQLGNEGKLGNEVKKQKTRHSQVQLGNEKTPKLGNEGGKPNWATVRQVVKIRKMWEQVSREKTEAALRTWLRRRFKVGAVEWLTVEQAAGVIEGLKAMGKCTY